jgi:hypothetical protein
MRSLLALFISTAAFAEGICDFPDPGYKISPFAGSGISMAQYDQALDLVQRVYSPIFARYGCNFKILRSWWDGTINAQAWRQGNTCYIEMFGGLARYPGMTKGAFTLVAAHEIGHHLGGPPYYRGEIMSVEGQADYYATWTGMPQMGLASRAGSFTLARAMAEWSGESAPWRPGPPLRPVWRTIESHPPAQCRLNTYDAGRLHHARPRCWFAR